MNRYICILLIFVATSLNASTNIDSPAWYEKDINNEPIIHLYFFWSSKCPHCQIALPDILQMEKEFSWLRLHSLQLYGNPQNIETFESMAHTLNQEAQSVPTFMFCRNLISGYDEKELTGRSLRIYLNACYQFALENNPDNNTDFILDPDQLNSIDVPFFGNISFNDYSLPILTIFIASMDAFNPCAFFVLLFLLSMMVHAQSRKKMLLIGGIFVFFSGLIYFIFMSAWLNLFIYLGELRAITFIAGLIAVVMATINIKDYFWFKKGISLSISENAKPKLFDRMRHLLRVDSLYTIIFATVVLAIVANSYELLCTAGFPMIYARILTLESLSIESYYLYLLLYNLIYIMPLLIIVLLFTIKLGSRKLSEQEGKTLKLLSGVMMLFLGLILLIAPDLLSNLSAAAAILLIAISTTWLMVKISKTQ